MKRYPACLALLALPLAGLLPAAEIPPWMGDWQGGYIDPPAKGYPATNPGLVARVVGRGDDRFEIQVMAEFDKRAQIEFSRTASADDGVIRYSGDGWTLRVGADAIEGSRRVKIDGEPTAIPIRLEKVERLSPTLGRPAPPDAEILFEGGLDRWEHENGKPATWKLLPDGVVECLPRKAGNPDGGDLSTRKRYRDCEVHLEFMLPYEPDAAGQGRANSGLFLQGDYEVQILDSYGGSGMWDECAALYRVSPPKVNMSAPPGQWQTFDIRFKAARYDDSGKLLSYPEITVRHNGKLVHNRQELREITQYHAARRAEPPVREAGPIRLQDHGHPIRFRNFWVREPGDGQM